MDHMTDPGASQPSVRNLNYGTDPSALATFDARTQYSHAGHTSSIPVTGPYSNHPGMGHVRLDQLYEPQGEPTRRTSLVWDSPTPNKQLSNAFTNGPTGYHGSQSISVDQRQGPAECVEVSSELDVPPRQDTVSGDGELTSQRPDWVRRDALPYTVDGNCRFLISKRIVEQGQKWNQTIFTWCNQGLSTRRDGMYNTRKCGS